MVHAANKEKYSPYLFLNMVHAANKEMYSPYLFLSREDDDDVRDIGKHDFRSVLVHPMLSNANRIVTRQHA